ncbi:hypothetical protein [Ruegeria arenilitoris]|uniref:hypothetical protein n=1 Tax=Ruegeria arenilitoris TaxID=1173585 RepID=UPI0014802FD3|nr:hypothetical protein [Ruegeria arenilitoris]
MTEQRASANREVFSYPNKRCTRAELQQEALIIESLLEAATALVGGNDSGDNMIVVMEMAQDRAKKLNAALDSVNHPELAS